MAGLPPPPCIKGLVDCRTSDSRGFSGGSGSFGTTGSSGSGGSGSSGTTDSGGSGGGNASSSSSTGNGGSSGISGIGSSLGSLGSALKERLLHYRVTVTNRGTSAVQGYAFTHGPLPSTATFDASRSTQGCVLAGSSVQCTMNLAPGETKNVDLVYTAKTSLSCVIAKVLASVKNVTVNAGQDVLTSVSCSLSDGQEFASSVPAAPQATGGAPLVGTVGQPNIQGIGLTYVQEPGYKPYTMPRTGAADSFFSRTTGAVTLTPVKRVAETGGVSFSSMLFTVIVFAVIIGRVLRRKAQSVHI